jgi:hypothetical protein
MTNDEPTLLVTRYRASVEDVATPILDKVILAAAGRQAAKRRLVRRGGAFFVTLLTALGIGVAWHSNQTDRDRAIFVVTNYGTIEGLTRSYLLEVGTTQYSGPGLTEGAQ